MLLLKRVLIAAAAAGICACAKAPRVEAPVAISIDPANGAGAKLTFVARYSDPKGAHHIKTAGVLINDEMVGASACYVMYLPARELLCLVEDTGVGSLRMPLDGESKVENSQCILYAKGSSATESGNELEVKASVEFKREFGGTKRIYLYAQNTDGADTSLLPARGAWLIP